MSKHSATPLAAWLRAQMKERGLSQAALSARAGVGAGTLNEILTRGQLPKVETLFCLADALDTSHLDILLITGHLRRGDELPGARTEPPDHEAERNMEWRLVEEFRRIPRELQPDALATIQIFARAEKRPRYRVIGGDVEDAKPG